MNYRGNLLGSYSSQDVRRIITPLIFISQIEKLDSDAIHPAFCRAEWRKLSKKIMVCRSKHYPFRKFKNSPPSPIKFDADRTADFFNKDVAKDAKLGNVSLLYDVCRLFSQDMPFSKIREKLVLYQQQLKRMIQKGLKWFVDHYEEAEGEIEGKNCIQAENGSSQEITPN